MIKDPLKLGRGLIVAAAWLVWFFTGYAYAQMHGPIKSFLSTMSRAETAVFACWLLVSTCLLYYAVAAIIRGLASSPNQPRA
jgi:hypothetical protein